MVSQKGKLFTLPRIGLQDVSPFSLWAPPYEKVLDKKRRVELSQLRNNQNLRNIARFEEIIPFFSDNGFDNLNSQMVAMLKKYSSIKQPCAMKVKDINELEEHILKVYQISYAHYVLGKTRNIRGRFPDYCCGPSSENIFFTLLSYGYPNAVSFADSENDHAYNGLPFAVGEKKGFIIIDPTSDQMWDLDESPRNLVFLCDGKKWEYSTDWKDGANLFPDKCLHIGNLRRYFPDYGPTKSFFEKVFKNVVDVRLPQTYTRHNPHKQESKKKNIFSQN